jgi:hypothetical protein
LPLWAQLALRIFPDELLQISAVGAVGADSCGGIRISMRPSLAQRCRRTTRRAVPGLNVRVSELAGWARPDGIREILLVGPQGLQRSTAT